MITLHDLRILKTAEVGLSSVEVNDWLEALTSALTAGAFWLGDKNIQAVDSVTTAFCGKSFNVFNAYEYTHGDKPLRILNLDNFRGQITDKDTFIRVPCGRPIKATYDKGQVTGVYALTSPGEYTQDITEAFKGLFPSGIKEDIEVLYAVLSTPESNWSKKILHIYEVLSGIRGFIPGIDTLTLSWVDGGDIQSFCDFGVMGTLETPEISRMFSDSCTNCMVIAYDSNRRVCRYPEVKSGEILSMHIQPSDKSGDTVFVSLDTGDTLSVTDLLTLRHLKEGDEVFYTAVKDFFMLSDEYSNFLLGAYSA